MNNAFTPRRAPILGLGVQHAKRVRAELGYEHPTELDIEVLAYMRGVLVRDAPSRGARASLLRIGERGVIGVAKGLSEGERRWAIGHELGHFEAHAAVSFLGLCTGEDLRTDYASAGREPEANAFAAELLLPEHLMNKECDIREVRWEPIEEIAKKFRVSLTAAARRFCQLSYERVGVVCCKNGSVVWADCSRAFGRRPSRGSKVDQWTLAFDFFSKNDLARRRETVSASAWIPDVSDSVELVEHVMPMPSFGQTLSLLWYPS